MTAQNPRAPSSKSDIGRGIATDTDSSERLRRLARAQRFIIPAFLGLIFAPLMVAIATSALTQAIYLAVVLYSIVGVVRLAMALGRSPVIGVLLAVPMIVPFVGLIVIADLNASATQQLRAGGCKVGLFGATARGV